MAQPGLIKNYGVANVVESYRIAVMTDVDFTVEVAIDTTKAIVGVSEHGSTEKMRCDVVMSGIAAVEFGADIAPGDAIVADADGKAIPFVAADYSEDSLTWVLGVALESGKDGTIGSVTVNPFVVVK